MRDVAAIIARPKTSQDDTMEPMVNIALRAARKAGENIVRASDDLDRVDVVAKGVNDFVSEVDIAAEQEITYHLQKAYRNIRSRQVQKLSVDWLLLVNDQRQPWRKPVTLAARV